MHIIHFLFGGALLIAATLASLAIWAPRPARIRFLALALVTVFIPIGYAQFAEMLSKPKPMRFEWFERNADKAIVLGMHLDEGQAIYLWLKLSGDTEPRYYKIPWNVKLAEKLEELIEGAVRRDSVLVIDKPFQKRSIEDWGDLNVQIIPPPVPLLKRPPVPNRIINPREFKI